MRKLLFSALLAATIVAAQTVKGLDVPISFMGVKLGTPVSKVTGLKEVFKTAYDTQHRRDGQKLDHESGAKLSKVDYRAVGGLIYTIEFNAASAQDSEKLLAWLQKTYGTGNVNTQEWTEVRWTGKRTRITYGHHPVGCPKACGGGVIFDIPLEKARDKAMQ